MAEPFVLRELAAVVESLSRKEKTLPIDSPSDSESSEEESYSGSESEEDAEEEDYLPESLHPYYEDKKVPIHGESGHQWFKHPPERSSQNNEHLVSFLPGPIGAAKDVNSPIEAWNLLFTDSMIEKITLHTNEEIQRHLEVTGILNRSNPTFSEVKVVEMRAFFGLLYLSGLQKLSNFSIDDLWDATLGSVVYRAAMPRSRFKLILANIRFDDKATRSERRKSDKFAPIRDVWEEFIANCTKYYNPSSFCTIGKQVIPFRGRCPFKVYNGSKPEKHGIKMLMLNDAKTYYMYNAIPHASKEKLEVLESVQSYYIRKLSEPLHGTDRNITCGNWFSSIPIFERMLADHSITMVGALRKSKGEIPDLFKLSGEIYSSKFVFDETKTLVSYTPKSHKIILLLSTYHHAAEISEDTRKSEILRFYNSTKRGTDIFDRMCEEYTTARSTNRWPLRIWMTMLDQGALNAMILHNFNSDLVNVDRRHFIRKLIQSLIEPHLGVRLLIPNLRRDVRFSILAMLQQDKADAEVTDTTQTTPTNSKPNTPNHKPMRCAYCPRKIDRKTQVYCQGCNKPVCGDHRFVYCLNCTNAE